MEKTYPIISKSDFIQYLKYLKLVLSDELNNRNVIETIDECIQIESEYNPSAYYYDDLLNDFNDLVESKVSKNIIRWTKIVTWKAYLRKNKIEKITKNNDL